MKATQGTSYRSLQAHLNRMTLEMHDLRMASATGKKLNRPSDDPSAVRPVLDGRTQVRASERFLKTMGTALDKMQALDGHMGHVENVLVRAKEVAIGAVNGTLDGQGMSILADQVRLMKEELLDTANAKIDGKYLFAGFQEDTRPFVLNAAYDPADPASSSVIYQGDANATRLEIGAGEFVQVNLTGDQLFMGNPGGINLFDVLTRLETAIRNEDLAGIDAEIGNLNAAADQGRKLRGLIGNNADRVETAIHHMEGVRIDLKQIVSRYEDADMIETFTRLLQQETAFQAALSVTTRVSQLSILNHM